MGREKLFSKRTIHAYILVVAVIFIFAIVAFLMLRYHVEGEKNMPFEIQEMDVISTAAGSNTKDDAGIWYSDLSQKNDIYFYIGKNENYKKEAMIKSITFDNFQINKYNKTGTAQIYRPSGDDTYNYTDDYIVKDSLIYSGGRSTDEQQFIINNQGGVVGFSILTSDIGKYQINDDETISVDGTLLKKAGITSDDIKMDVSFDITIETESGDKFKASDTINLPSGNILDEGVSTEKITDLSHLVFKRGRI